MQVSPLAGNTADPSILINVPRLVTAYYTGRPDPSVPGQRVVFGTSGHRGCSLDNAFNEAHILAITQAIWKWCTPTTLRDLRRGFATVLGNSRAISYTEESGPAIERAAQLSPST